jgi:hypothetical protein
MTSILLAVQEALEASTQDATRTRLAAQAVDWLKPLVAKAGGIINGVSAADADTVQPQGDADVIMSN